MNDHVFPVGFVDPRLARPPPGIKSRGVIGKYANDVKIIGIDEIHAAGIGDAAAENKMKERIAHAGASGRR